MSHLNPISDSNRSSPPIGSFSLTSRPPSTSLGPSAGIHVLGISPPSNDDSERGFTLTRSWVLPAQSSMRTGTITETLQDCRYAGSIRPIPGIVLFGMGTWRLEDVLRSMEGDKDEADSNSEANTELQDAGTAASPDPESTDPPSLRTDDLSHLSLVDRAIMRQARSQLGVEINGDAESFGCVLDALAKLQRIEVYIAPESVRAEWAKRVEES